jgi:hypothetical protein
LESKVKFEEQLMVQKELVHSLRLALAQIEEKLIVARDTV